MWRLAAAALLTATTAAAATWTCDERHELVGKTLVLARCVAHGAYTAGGDAIGTVSPGADLCNSDNRIPVDSLVSAAESGTTGQGYLVTFGRATHHIYMLTAGDAPGKGNALVELLGGTSIEGATVSVLTVCK